MRLHFLLEAHLCRQSRKGFVLELSQGGYSHEATTCFCGNSPLYRQCSLPQAQCWARWHSTGSLLQKRTPRKSSMFSLPGEHAGMVSLSMLLNQGQTLPWPNRLQGIGLWYKIIKKSCSLTTSWTGKYKDIGDLCYGGFHVKTWEQRKKKSSPWDEPVTYWVCPNPFQAAQTSQLKLTRDTS